MPIASVSLHRDEFMKLPIAWLMDYLPEHVQGAHWEPALAEACKRWDLEPSSDSAQTLARLMTFAGFSCDGVNGSGLNAILELDVLSNRPDGQCILGLAREVAAVLQVDVKVPPAEPDGMEKGEPAETLAKVDVLEPKLCTRYTARVIRGVKVGPSPEWLQERLKWIGLQPRNNIVDVTNFICFELNQPLHAFDLRGLSGQKIIVRRATDKEPFSPLYGEIPPLTPETLLIADAERPRAVAGVLGGKGSEVTPETVDILLEAACFDPANTRRTVRRLKVMDGKGTDSSYRFERGVDVESVARASARAARLIVQIAGGSIAPGVIDVWPAPRARKTVLLRLPELQRVFGGAVPKQEVLRSLAAIGCTIVAEGAADLHVRIPSWRRGDLEREIDLIEEVARLYGYNHVPAVTAMSARVPVRSAIETATNTVRNTLTATGYFEVTSDSLIDPKWPQASVWTAEPPLQLDKASVLREDHSALRNTLLPSLLAVRTHNQNQRTGEARLFEIGRVFIPGKDPRPEEKLVLGLLDDRGYQALADTLLRLGPGLELDGAHLKLTPPKAAPEFLKSGYACRIMRVRQMHGDERAEDAIGWIGVLSPALQQAFDLRKPVAVAELDFRALAGLPRAPHRYKDLPAYPEIGRDTALVVDESVPWMDIESFARSWQTHEPLRDPNEAPKFLSVFRGDKIGAGKKSVAFSIQYRAANRTLTDEEVEAAHKKFQQALLERFKATLRT
jgi:phenylalanyl-tRNA synthetase beta chain